MKKHAKRVWHFIWDDNSALSWAVNVALAFVIIKFLVYPGLGFALSTENPVVAVVSCSMEHKATNCGTDRAYQLCGQAFPEKQGFGIERYWQTCGDWYESKNISKQEFSGFQFKNGFNKGDLMILKGTDGEALKAGDIIVFRGPEKDPVIHRVITKNKEKNNQYTLATKGDNNDRQLQYETRITEDQVIGRAVIRLPLLGHVKLLFTWLIGALM